MLGVRAQFDKLISRNPYLRNVAIRRRQKSENQGWGVIPVFHEWSKADAPQTFKEGMGTSSSVTSLCILISSENKARFLPLSPLA
jgi:hypothetical protein